VNWTAWRIPAWEDKYLSSEGNAQTTLPPIPEGGNQFFRLRVTEP
jgi:hypothetical protein